MIGELILVDCLNHNLLRISQLCGKGESVTVDFSEWMVIKSKYDQAVFTSSKTRNTYTLNINKINLNDILLKSNKDESSL